MVRASSNTFLAGQSLFLISKFQFYTQDGIAERVLCSISIYGLSQFIYFLRFLFVESEKSFSIALCSWVSFVVFVFIFINFSAKFRLYRCSTEFESKYFQLNAGCIVKRENFLLCIKLRCIVRCSLFFFRFKKFEKL